MIMKKYDGLTSQEVNEKKADGLVNGTARRMTRSYKEIIKGNLLTYFNIINLILFGLVMITGKFTNGLFILTIIFNAIIGIYQEVKSKKLLDRMSIMVASKVEVKRDGQWSKIDCAEIVQDDLIRLNSGMQIPADGELLEGAIEVNESMLTGESDVVSKNPGDPIYSGTVVTSGHAEVHVQKVGKECVTAQIMEDAQKEKRAKSRLHDNLEKLIGIISIVIIPAGAVLFLTQKMFIGLSWRDAILKTVAAVVGMIPEGLVVLTSIALAVSTVRLSKRKVLVQDLFSIESLARVDTICLDKTGTLTKGTMKVTDVVPLCGTDTTYIRKVMGAYLRSDDKPNATSQAMIDYFHVGSEYEKTEELPFSSDRKYAGAALKGEGSFYVGAVGFLFPKGAPAVCKRISYFTEKGERVVILARSHEEHIQKDRLPEDLEPIAMIAIRDILRDNVEDIMQYFVKQDVDIRVISGDDPATVSSLALQAGIPGATQYLDMSQNTESFDEIVKKYKIFGRVLPDQKKKLVKALQNQGHTVAMTGDGVNDVPALKTADVSVAMASGSDAAKDSANIVLLTDDFGKMPGIVDEGRRVINNISRASSMYLVKTTFSILLSLYVIVMHQEYPFLPVHLSIISALGVGLPTFLLQLEPSFERVNNNFFSNAFKNAIPSAFAVFVTAMLSIVIRDVFMLSDVRFYGIFVLLTSYIYIYTLYCVYYPPTKLRVLIIGLICFLFLAVYLLFGNIVSVSYTWMDLLAIIPGLLIIPIVISLTSTAINTVIDWFGKYGKEKHVTQE